MFSYIKKQIEGLKGITGKRILLENFISLSMLQVVNHILPLITVPFLLRILGFEKYGLIAFAQAFITYFIIITDYGFNLSATRKISIYREDRKKVTEIFNAVIFIKSLLLLLSFVVLAALVFGIGRFRTDWTIYLFTFGMVIGNILFPVWFFQGMEKMKYITLLNILAKTIFTISIFILIRRQSDYLYVPLINSSGLIFSGLLSLWLVWKNFKVRLKVPSLEAVIEQLRDGWQIFISSIATSLYTVSTSFILGLFTNNTIVGYYCVGEKITRVLVNLITPISQTLFPRVSLLAKESKEQALQFLRQLCFAAGFLILSSCFMIFIFADKITLILSGQQCLQSVLVIKILAFSPFIIFLSNILGTQIMIPFNLLRERTKVLTLAGILNLGLLFILVPSYQHIGASISLMVTEISVTAGLLMYLIKSRIFIPIELRINETR